MSKKQLTILILIGLICTFYCNCSICKGEYLFGGTIGNNCTKHWWIFNWWELLKINRNSVDVWIKIVFKLIKPFPKPSYYEMDLEMPYKIYNLEVYPTSNTSAGKYLNYTKSGNDLILRINKSVVKHYRFYAVAIHYKIKKHEIITKKFIKFPIPLIDKFIQSPEISLRYGLNTGFNIDFLIPKRIHKNAVIVNFFVVLPNNTIEYHINMPKKMLILPPKIFDATYKKYFTEWVCVNYKDCKLPFRINVSNTQPVLYYVSGRSPPTPIYIEYTVTNYPVMWMVFFATVFGLVSAVISLILCFLKIFKLMKFK